MEASGGPEVRVDVQLTFEEYRRATKYLRDQRAIVWFWTGSVAWWIYLAFFNLVVVNLLGLPPALHDLVWLGAVGIAAVLWYRCPLQTVWGQRKRWNAAPRLQERRTYVFSLASFEILTEEEHKSVFWRSLVQAKLGPTIARFEDRHRDLYIVPLRAFESADHLRRFEQLLEMALPGCEGLQGIGRR